MKGFKDIIGNDILKEQFSGAIRTGSISHAYMLSGDRGMGKKRFARAFCQELFCEHPVDGGACGICPSCKKVESGNHPDVIWIRAEKPDVIKVDEIRQQIVDTVDIRPFLGDRKIYIIPDADRMNPQAQNALLKVLEARDTSVKALADIEGAPYNYGSKNTADELIEIVLDERAKELAGEGFRWSDLRRNSAYGIRLNRPGTSGDQNQQFRIYFGNYNLARFALPVPYSETASEQWANGHGLFDNGTQDSENWQNNAWDRKVGNTYTISEDGLLPTNGSGLDDEGNVL